MNRRLLTIIMAASFLLLAPSVAMARAGSKDQTTSSNSSDSSQTSDEQENAQASALVTSRQGSTERDREAAAEDKQKAAVTEAEDHGKAMLESLAGKVQKHTDEQRQKNCQAAQHGLETRLTNLQKNAANFQTKIDSVYQMALDYQVANSLNPSGIDQLEAAADSAKAVSAASVGALSALSVNLDCTSSTVADNVATFRAATAQARSDLNAYKTAVIAVLTGLEGAKNA